MKHLPSRFVLVSTHLYIPFRPAAQAVSVSPHRKEEGIITPACSILFRLRMAAEVVGPGSAVEVAEAVTEEVMVAWVLASLTVK